MFTSSRQDSFSSSHLIGCSSEVSRESGAICDVVDEECAEDLVDDASSDGHGVWFQSGVSCK